MDELVCTVQSSAEMVEISARGSLCTGSGFHRFQVPQRHCHLKRHRSRMPALDHENRVVFLVLDLRRQFNQPGNSWPVWMK